MGQKFQRRQENFPCQHCGAFILGNGYTNHCPHCLWSRHVDQYPGDRAESCGGMMEPVLLEGSSPNYRILHRCSRCGFERVNAVQHEDSTEAIVALARNPHPPLGIQINTETGEQFDPLSREKAAEEIGDREAEKGNKQSNIRRKE